LAACGFPEELLTASNKPHPSGNEQVSNALAVRDALGSALFNVQLGPIGPQWCTHETLAQIATVSAENDMRVHMHLLETERQRQWLDETYGNHPIQWLDGLGLLSPRLTVAHGVWLRADECELLAERGVVIAVNSSSNLRLRSGIASVSQYREAGAAFAVGLDGSGIDDDQDMLRELRLFKYLHSGMGLIDRMPVADVLKSAFESGFRTFAGQCGYGLLEPGAPADIVILDTERLTVDAVDPNDYLADLVFARASSSDIVSMTVAGCEVVADGKLVGLDFESARAELVESARATGRRDSAGKSHIQARREAIRHYYGSGHHLD